MSEDEEEIDEDRREGKQQGIYQDLFIEGVKQHVYNNPVMAKKLNTMLTSWNNDMLIDRFDVRHLCDTPSMLKAFIAVSSSSSSSYKDAATTKTSQYELLAADYYFDPDLVDELQFERYQDYVVEEEDEEEGKVVLEEPSQLLDSFSEWNQSGYISNRKEIWTKSDADAAVAVAASVNDCGLQLDNIENSQFSSEEEETQRRDFEVPVWYIKLISQCCNSISSSINQANDEADNDTKIDESYINGGVNVSTAECVTTTTASTARSSPSINWKIPYSRKQYQIILHTAKTIRDRDKKFSHTGSSTNTDDNKNTTAVSDPTIVAHNDKSSSSAHLTTTASFIQPLPPSSSTIASTRASSSSGTAGAGAGTQLEILLKVKQADNPLFAFLMSPHHCYHAFYWYLKEQIDEAAFWEIFMEKESTTNNMTTSNTTVTTTDKNTTATTEAAAVIVKNNNDNNSNKPNALSLLGSMYDDDDDDDDDDTSSSTGTTTMMTADTSHTIIPSSISSNAAIVTNNNSNITNGDTTTIMIPSKKEEVEEGDSSGSEEEMIINRDVDKSESRNGNTIVYNSSSSDDGNGSSNDSSSITNIIGATTTAEAAAVSLKQAQRREKAKLLFAQKLLKQTAPAETDGEDELNDVITATTTAAVINYTSSCFASTTGCSVAIGENIKSGTNNAFKDVLKVKNEVPPTEAATSTVEDTIALQQPLQQSQSQEQMSKKDNNSKRRRWDVVIINSDNTTSGTTAEYNTSARVTSDDIIAAAKNNNGNKCMISITCKGNIINSNTTDNRSNVEDAMAMMRSSNPERSIKTISKDTETGGIIDITTPLLSSYKSDHQLRQLQQSSASAQLPSSTELSTIPPSSESVALVITKSKRKRASRWDT